MTDRSARKLLFIGWDAADWLILDHLLDGGRMPNLGSLIARGVRANLTTLEPKLSPLLWTSIATGKTADKHGILNFVEPKPDGSGLRVSASTSRRSKAIWNILSQNDLSTNVVAWYASHPAEPIRGQVVSNLLQEGEPKDALTTWTLPTHTVHPPSLTETIAAARQRRSAFPRGVLTELVKRLTDVGPNDTRVETLTKLMSAATSVEASARALLSSGAKWDCTMVFFDAIDTVGHHFMQFRAPRMLHVREREAKIFGGVMDAVYEWHDAALGRLLATAGADTTVILASDHGFHSDHLRPNLSELPPERRMELESSWHRPLGMLVMSGPGVRVGAELASPNILDIAPTILALLGIPCGEDMDGRVLAEALSSPSMQERVPSWDGVDGDAGLHPSELRQDPFEAADAIKQLVDLGYMAALPEDVQGQLDLVRRESTFNLAVALMSRRRSLEAITHFEQLHAQRPHEARYALCLGNCLLSAGRFQEAASLMAAFSAHDPKNVEARLLAANAFALSGDLAAARGATEEVTRIASARPELALQVAQVLTVSQRHDEAESFYKLALGRNAREPAAHIGLCHCCIVRGSFEEAVDHALNALELTQKLPEAHLLLGIALAWSGELVHAKSSFEFALAHDGGQVDAVRWLAVLAEHAKDASSAHTHRNRAQVLLATAPERPPEIRYGASDFAKKHHLSAI